MRPAVNSEQASGLISSQRFLHRDRCPGRCQYGRRQRRERIRTQSSQSGVVLEDMLKLFQGDFLDRRWLHKSNSNTANGMQGPAAIGGLAGLRLGLGSTMALAAYFVVVADQRGNQHPQ